MLWVNFFPSDKCSCALPQSKTPVRISARSACPVWRSTQKMLDRNWTAKQTQVKNYTTDTGLRAGHTVFFFLLLEFLTERSKEKPATFSSSRSAESAKKLKTMRKKNDKSSFLSFSLCTGGECLNHKHLSPNTWFFELSHSFVFQIFVSDYGRTHSSHTRISVPRLDYCCIVVLSYPHSPRK